jgi:hypothetical protein
MKKESAKAKTKTLQFAKAKNEGEECEAAPHL